MDANRARALLDRLHAAQGSLYAGGDPEPVRALLTADVEWRVPGSNAIAGSYRGVDAVLAYFLRRRDIAGGSFRMHPREFLAGEREHVAMLTDGTATLGGRERSWSTIGLYRLGEQRIAACWLLPLDQRAFDEIWSPPG